MPEPASPSVPAHPGAAPLTASVGHYENFPVASWLCPAPLRPAVMAIYHFARTADDLADEGHATPAERLAQLAQYRQSLTVCLAGGPAQAWPTVFGPLGAAVRSHALPASLLHDLISAFEQDVRHTAAGHVYANADELLGYCRLSANPVGRLLLHLYGVNDPVSLSQSDAVCSALQLINFWQDIRIDHARGRHYLPADRLHRHGLTLSDFAPTFNATTGPRCQALVAELCDEARLLMSEGAPLARRLPGRIGWELRLVIQGGLRVLEKIAGLDHRSWLQRPEITRADLPILLWRALRGANIRPRARAG